MKQRRDGMNGADRGAGFGKLPRSRMSDQVAGAIQAAIAERRFELGERLPSEQELAASFATSRGTVREALRALEAMGFVEIRTGAGAFVATTPLGVGALEERLSWLLDRRDVVLEILDVRESLEATAAHRCASNATTRQLRAIGRVLPRMEAAVAGDDAEEFSTADFDFHLSIARNAANRTLAELIEYTLRVYRASNRVLIDVRGRSAQSLAEHQVIVEQLLARNGDGAEAAMRSHIRSVKADLERLSAAEAAAS